MHFSTAQFNNVHKVSSSSHLCSSPSFIEASTPTLWACVHHCGCNWHFVITMYHIVCIGWMHLAFEMMNQQRRVTWLRSTPVRFTGSLCSLFGFVLCKLTDVFRSVKQLFLASAGSCFPSLKQPHYLLSNVTTTINHGLKHRVHTGDQRSVRPRCFWVWPCAFSHWRGSLLSGVYHHGHHSSTPQSLSWRWPPPKYNSPPYYSTATIQTIMCQDAFVKALQITCVHSPWKVILKHSPLIQQPPLSTAQIQIS